MNFDAFTDIINELTAPMSAERPNGIWNKIAMRNASKKQGLVKWRILVGLVEQLDTDKVAEVLARIAAQEKVFDTATRAFNDYRKRLAA